MMPRPPGSTRTDTLLPYTALVRSMAAIRTDYQAYIEKRLAAAGQSDAAAKAKRIYDLELKIARAHASREQSEDFTQSADVWAKADFAKKAQIGRAHV